MDLVLLELFAGRELDGDDASGIGRGQDLRPVRLDTHGARVPALHDPPPFTRRLSRKRSIASVRRSSSTVSEILKKPSPFGPYAPPGDTTTPDSSSTSSQ